MVKKELVNLIVEDATVKSCKIVKVYGLSMSVGYDLNVDVDFKIASATFKAHAMSKSWALIGHLRPMQEEFKKYTGSNDIYRERVVDFWEKTPKKALSEFLIRMSKSQLEVFAKQLMLI